MNNKEKLLRTVEWIDEKRWESSTTKSLVNDISFKKLPPEHKILVHWLCYITDRQMPYQEIWSRGALVFSSIVNDIQNNDFQNVITKEEEYINEAKENVKKIGIVSVINDDSFRFISNGNEFASRFISTDIKSVILTLKILSVDYDFNIVKYINETYKQFNKLIEKDNELNLLLLVAFSFHLLSYEFFKNPIKGETENKVEYLKENIKNDINKYYNEFHETLNNSNDQFEIRFKEFTKNRFSGKKRTWCCVRDYLKSEFNNYFIEALKSIRDHNSLMNIFNYNKEDYLKYLELPGDVWNLKDVFIENLISPNLGPLSYSNIPRSLREALKDDPVYPEQFDFSFDFVPRMCEAPLNKLNQSNCSVCLFGKGEVLKYCHENPDKNCPITNFSFGYINNCKPDNCPISGKQSLELCQLIKKKVT